ncbi:MAG: ankyrin repeat domain-containing protein, partial [Firmicutes bacterium]|nr:ankyrin repeat domain-containing protein [Bacillota bacterium]
MLKKGVDVNTKDKDGNTILNYAESEDFINFLLTKGAVTGSDLIFGRTTMMSLILDSPEKIDIIYNLSRLNSIKAKLNEKDKNENTALMLAVKENYIKIVEISSKIRGINVNLQNKDGDTALMIALKKKYEEIAKILSKVQGINVNLQNVDGNTALMLAVKRGYEEIAKVLSKVQGINVNLQNVDGNTALMLALEKEYEEIAKILSKTEGIDVNLQNKNFETVLMMALREGYKEIAIDLLKNEKINANLQDRNGDTALCFFLNFLRNEKRTPQFKELKKLLSTKCTVELIDIDYENLEEKDKDPVTVKDLKDGSTALMLIILNDFLCEYEKNKRVKELLKLEDTKKSLNKQCEDGKTALMMSVERCFEEITETLLKVEGIDINLQDENGDTVLMLALENNYEKLAEMLSETGLVNVNLQNKNGQTPLMLAARNNCVKTGKILLKFEMVDVNLQDKKGQTALNYCENNNFRKLLHAKGGLTDYDLKSGRTPLMSLILMSYSKDETYEMVKDLLKSENVKKSLNKQEKDGNTALMLSIIKDYEKVAYMLSEVQFKDIDVNLQNKNGQTVLMFAILSIYNMENHYEKIVINLLNSKKVIY